MKMECDLDDVSGQGLKYEVRISEKLGRYMVASRDLKAGEVLISECPLVVGPTCDSPLLCFACHTPLAGKFSCCESCKRAPVCSGRLCQHSEGSWHDEAECALFASSPHLTAVTLVNNMAALLPLRCLLKRRSDPSGWQQLMMMEHHLRERRGTDIWSFHQSTVQLLESLGLVSPEQDTDLVQRVCGVLDVNCFELRAPSSSLPLRGVYPTAALMAHHCQGNTHLAVGSQRHNKSSQALTVRAATFIQRGDIIFYNYVDLLEGTARRQERLLIGKYFTCQCTRCLDPTELSTDLSSVHCPASACSGLLDPPTLHLSKLIDNSDKHIHTDGANGESSETNAQKFNTSDFESELQELEDSKENNGTSVNVLGSELRDKLEESKEDNGTSANVLGSELREKLEDSKENNGTSVNVLGSELREKLDDSNYNGSGRNVRSDVCEVQNGHFASGGEFWRCRNCGEKIQRCVVESKVEACSRKLDSIDKSSEEQLSEYVDKVSVMLSPRHYLVLSAQQALAGVLRERLQRESRPTARLLRQYRELCSQLLRVLERLQPGISRAKAITLYEYQAASVMLARKLFEAREMTPDVYMEELRRAQEVLKRSTGMLVLEPSASPEGALCARAFQELRDLRAATQAQIDATATHTIT